MYKRSLRGVYLLCALSYMGAVYSPVSAQSGLDSLQTIKEVVVTANTVAKEVIPVQELSGIQLQRLSSHNVADAIRYFSGVQIKDYGGIGGLKSVNIRSMGTNHVGVFYDGIELGNAQNGTVDLGRFSLDNIEAITLYNGQKSAIFQSAKDFGSAGSIYIRSRMPSFEGDEKNKYKVSFKTGSFGLANPSFVWDRKLGGKTSAQIGAEYMYTTGKYKFTYRVADSYDTTAIRENGDVNALRVEGGFWGSVPDGYWKIKGYFYNSERGYPGAVVKNKFSHEDRQWDLNTFVQGSFRKDYSDRYSLSVNGKYAYDYLHYLADPNKDEALMYIDNRYYQHEIYFSVANKYSVTKFWDLALSADYQFNLLDADLTDFVYPRRHTELLAVATAIDIEWLKFQTSILGSFVQESVKSGSEASDEKMEWTPTAVLSIRPFREIGFNIRAFYKRIFRMPTLNDLYYTFIGNIDLEPEYTNQYNVGLTYAKSFRNGAVRAIDFQIDGYYNEVENKIVAMPTSNFFRWTMINLGKVEIKGFDIALQSLLRFGKNMNMTTRINYTYQKARDFTDRNDTYYGGQIPYIPWHSGSATVSLNCLKWEANYSFIYTGERYSSRANTPDNYLLPWYTSDFSIAFNQPLRSDRIKITLEINNIFNQQYEVVICYPMPGINFRTILQYEF